VQSIGAPHHTQQTDDIRPGRPHDTSIDAFRCVHFMCVATAPVRSRRPIRPEQLARPLSGLICRGAWMDERSDIRRTLAHTHAVNARLSVYLSRSGHTHTHTHNPLCVFCRAVLIFLLHVCVCLYVSVSVAGLFFSAPVCLCASARHAPRQRVRDEEFSFRHPHTHTPRGHLTPA